MVAMSFGDHIEELRTRLILALIGLFVGVIIAFIPPLNLGQWVMRQMQEPAQKALDEVLRESDRTAPRPRPRTSRRSSARRRPSIPAEDVRRPSSAQIAPELADLRRARGLKGRTVTLPITMRAGGHDQDRRHVGRAAQQRR